MAYDDRLEARIDDMTATWQLTKKRMFGCMAYFKDGTMVFAARGGELLFKLPPEDVAAALRNPGMHQAVMGERVMKHWLQAGGEAIAGDDALLGLMERCRDSVVRQTEGPSRPKSMPF